MDGKTLRFYCCGPTVYGPAHIGNFRTFVMQDVFRRVLELGGVPTTHIRNLTDVDDKTIRDSQKAGVSLAEFTAGWADLFHRDCAALNCLPPHAEPSAVGHIPEQIRMVQTLVEKGHAYVSEDGSVYFRISSFPEYGRLSHLDERELDLGKTANTRSNADEYEKDSVADFVLWKSRRPEDGDNFWTSPWGEGRPGWHLECSAMIHKYFGNDFDLHSGGVDLVFPHHENEIAQSEAANGKPFAHYWMHNGYINIDGTKMSKSLGNFKTVRDLLQHYDGEVLRFLILNGQYRGPIDFNSEILEQSRNAMTRLRNAKSNLNHLIETGSGSMTDEEKEKLAGYDKYRQEFIKAMDDDLNTPIVIAHLFDGAKMVNNILAGNDTITAADLNELKETFRLFCFDILGLKAENASNAAREEAFGHVVDMLLEERAKAKANKDWATSDKIRNELTALGFEIKDGKDGSEWKLNK